MKHDSIHEQEIMNYDAFSFGFFICCPQNHTAVLLEGGLQSSPADKVRGIILLMWESEKYRLLGLF